jgi:hypothetical protein
MALQPGEDIGTEIHKSHDQFFRVEKGRGDFVIDGVTTAIKGGWAMVVPAGARHNIINTGDKPLRLYTIYSPPRHLDRIVKHTKADALAAPEHFMIAVAPVREEAKSRIPAVTHVDGTARVHLVDRTVNPIYYDLIKALGDRTGVPVLLNTSFNLRGEPIVNTPADAIRTFQWSGMDALVLGRTLLVKEDLTI